jgi:hypothetical protein
MSNPTLRMYVDENGNHCLNEDLRNDSNRFLCLTGIVMRIEEHDILELQLNALKNTYFGSKNVILHRRELISGKEPFSCLKDPTVRENFNADLIEIIRSLRYGIISVVIDKLKLVERHGPIQAHDPYALAIEYLMQRYQYWLQDYCKKNHACTGDILAESRGGREDMLTKNTYKAIYRGQGYHPLLDASKYFSSSEIKLKKKSENIAGLQFVDIISHPARRFILSSNDLAPNIKQSSYEQAIVEILTDSKFRRKNGNINGHGAVLYPK